MEKLHSLAFYTLITPVITLSAGAVLAQSAGQDIGAKQQSSQYHKSAQHDQKVIQPTTKAGKNDPKKGDLIGAEIKPTGGNKVGSVVERIFDETARSWQL